MRNIYIISGAMLLALGACSAQNTETNTDKSFADTILTGGTIYTMDTSQTVASAMAVKDGKIVALGTVDEMQAYSGDATQTIDLNGATVFPGFTDAHVHVAGGGEGLRGLTLHDAQTPDVMLAKIKAYADAHPDMPVITGFGWELNVFEAGNPHKSLLDEIIPDRPVILTAADGHNSWVNSKAFEMAGVTADTPDPVAGHIEKDADGQPSGTLRESAMKLMAGILPEVTKADMVANLRAGAEFQLSNGIVGSIDAAISANMEEQAYLDAATDPKYPQRFRVSLLASDHSVSSIVTEENVDAVVETLSERRQKFREANKGRVDAESVKIFVDGVPENFTAAMHDPYVGVPQGPDHRGVMNLTENALIKYVTALDNKGFNILTHSMGDRAIDATLTAFEQMMEANPARDRRNHISHLEFLTPTSFKRFDVPGMAANIQSLWHFNDPYISELTEPFVKPEIHRWIYPAKSFKDAGAKLVWGSDWPVSTSNPFMSIEVAVLRQDPNNAEDTPWIPEEKLTVDDMMVALTRNGAWIMGQDDIRGTLEAGKLADFIILSADPYKVKPYDISEITVKATYLEGEQVYSN
ncbi:amidohydrolase [Kordiimonas sediminis]|uniref:Amidohydrolase n=1 Tax=Kordiimonas sediminis TaxID=1735581 RepID=A0A919AUD2_9PROT|nr:amidohydrolase [Kordiimonas sediminis]GHF26491.1 amidohydrolase [Kordiimonas sediminis]